MEVVSASVCQSVSLSVRDALVGAFCHVGQRASVALDALLVAFQLLRQGRNDLSAATIDRMLTPVRKGAGIRRRRRLAKKLTKEIPIKTFADWKDPVPGFLEIDF